MVKLVLKKNGDGDEQFLLEIAILQSRACERRRKIAFFPRHREMSRARAAAFCRQPELVTRALELTLGIEFKLSGGASHINHH